MYWFRKPKKQQPIRRTVRMHVNPLEDRTVPAVMVADVPTAPTFQMPIGDKFAPDASRLTIDSFASGYPKVRFNDDGDSTAEADEWYVATAFNQTQYLSGGWNSGSTGVYDNGAAHPGEDWNLNLGGNIEQTQQQPVFAIGEGIVLHAGWVNGYGNTVITAHKTTAGEIITSFISHLDSIAVQAGWRVHQGDKTGVVGNSGNAGLAHGHFEIRRQSMIVINAGSISLAYPANMWPAASKQVNGDGGSQFIANNYYNPSQFIQSHSTPTASLQNDVAVGTFSGVYDSQRLFKISVPAGQSNVRFETWGGSGDVDLYVRRGAPPTLKAYDKRPYLGGNSETAEITNPAADTYYGMLHGFGNFSGVMLRARYGSTVRTLQNNVAVTNLSGARNSQSLFQFVVPAGARSVTFTISGGTGDVDLYVRRGSIPTLSVWDQRPYRSGNNEQVTISYPAAGTYFLMLHGYASFSGVTLRAYYTF